MTPDEDKTGKMAGRTKGWWNLSPASFLESPTRRRIKCLNAQFVDRLNWTTSRTAIVSAIHRAFCPQEWGVYSVYPTPVQPPMKSQKNQIEWEIIMPSSRS